MARHPFWGTPPRQLAFELRRFFLQEFVNFGFDENDLCILFNQEKN